MRFLCGGLGDPRLFNEKYRSIRIPEANHHQNIGYAEHDVRLKCMKLAINKQLCEPCFKVHLLEQLAEPAERSRNKK